VWVLCSGCFYWLNTLPWPQWRHARRRRPVSHRGAARAHQGFELSTGLEDIEPADSAQDVLAHLSLLAKALDDLEVGIGAGAFDAKIHRRFVPLLIGRRGEAMQQKTAYPYQNLALHFEIAKIKTAKNGRFQQIFSPNPVFL
jgi:hypothetical protein